MTDTTEWLRISAVAELWGVTPKTVVRWANDGRVPCIRTLGGHRRFRRADVERVMAEGTAA